MKKGSQGTTLLQKGPHFWVLAPLFHLIWFPSPSSPCFSWAFNRSSTHSSLFPCIPGLITLYRYTSGDLFAQTVFFPPVF